MPGCKAGAGCLYILLRRIATELAVHRIYSGFLESMRFCAERNCLFEKA